MRRKKQNGQIANEGYELVAIDSVKPHPKNPRKGNVGLVRELIRENKFFGACVVQKSTRFILAGNHAYKAAKAEGLDQVPVIWVDVDDKRAAKIMAADNKASDGSTYDNSMLVELLRVNDDLVGTGFDGSELERLVRIVEPIQETSTPEPPKNPVTKPGQVWQLGAHRIVCGDCRDEKTVFLLLDGAQLNLGFTSPPYAAQRKYDKSSGFEPIPAGDYVDWFGPVQKHVRSSLAPDGSWFVNIKAHSEGLDVSTYVLELVIAHVRRWGWHFASEFCWERGGIPGKPRRRFKNQFEPIYQFAMGEWKFRPEQVRHDSSGVPSYSRNNHLNAGLNDDTAGYGGAGWASVTKGLAYPGNRLPVMGNSTSREAGRHVARFPVGLPEFFIRAYTDEGDKVFDPFMGSGSTLVAAEMHDRVAFGCEISPGYCDVIVERWQQKTGGKARRVI